MKFFLLYIDPGTGSALFSILIGVVATLYFLSRALILKIKVILADSSILSISTTTNSYVIYNEGKQYSNVFLPVIREFEERKINLSYLTSSEDDPILKEQYNFIKSEFIGEGNKAFSKLNLIKANVVLMTTPGLDVYQLKRSKGVKHYAHLLHATNDATLYRLFGIDYYDSILLTADYQAKDIKSLEEKRGLPSKQLITIGCSYLDVFTEKINQIPKENNHSFTVLVSPSWGTSSILSRYGEKLLDHLSETGFKIIIRPHPQSKKSESNLLEKLHKKYNNNLCFEWDYETENIYSLSRADIMISDFSGIIYDYIFLFDKPVIYVKQNLDLRPYDAYDLYENAIEELWQFKTLKEIGIELKEEDFPNIRQIIENASDSEELRVARKKAKDTAWQYQGEAGKRIADFLLSIA